jgi:hypothetical protein
MAGKMRRFGGIAHLRQRFAGVSGLILAVVFASALSACTSTGPREAGTAADTAALGQGRITDLPPSQIGTLEHLTAADLVARLGPPNFTRRDPPAELWQYRGATCVLDLFLYPDNGTLKVSHAQSRVRHTEQAASLGGNLCSPFSPETTASTS